MDLASFFGYIRKNDPKFYRNFVLLSVILVFFLLALLLLDFYRYELVQNNLKNFSVTSTRLRQAEDLQDKMQRYKDMLAVMEPSTRKDVDTIQNYLFQQANLYKIQVDRVVLAPGTDESSATYEMRVSGDWNSTMNFLAAAFYGDKYLLNITDITMEVDARGRLNTTFHYKVYFTPDAARNT
jgi:hypothetical protein